MLKFDFWVRSRMKTREAEANFSAIWDRVEVVLDQQQRKRRAALLWWGIGIAGSVAITLGIWGIHKGDSTPPNLAYADQFTTRPSVEVDQARELILPMPFLSAKETKYLPQVSQLPQKSIHLQAVWKKKPINDIEPVALQISQLEVPVSILEAEKILPVTKDRWIAALTLSAGASQRRLQYAADDPIAMELQSALTPLENMHAGIRYEWIHQSGFQVQTGLDWMRVNEVFEYTYSHYESVTLDNEVIEIIVGLNGRDTTQVRGSVATSKKLTHDILHYNQTDWAQIPIGLGYTHQFGRFQLGIGMEAIGQILLKANGISLNQELIPVSLEDLDYKPGNFYIAGRANLNLGWKISPRLDIQFQPAFSFGQSPRQTHFIDLGGQIGLRCRLR